MLDLKDKLNLCWKFLFLAVFTYGVMSVACCSNSCDSKKACSTKQECSMKKSCCSSGTTCCSEKSATPQPHTH